MRENKNARVLMDNLDSEVDWPRTSPYSRRRARLARLDLRKSLIAPDQLICNGHGAMAPSSTRDHHQLRLNRLTKRVISLPVFLLRHLSISLELTVGGNVGESRRSARSDSESAFAFLYDAVWAMPYMSNN